MTGAVRAIGDRKVAPVGIGGVQWSLADERDDELSIRTIREALDAGVDLIDTAHAYTTLSEPTHNENIVRQALAGYRGDVLVATKGGHWRAGQSDFPIDGRPSTLRSHLEQSLVALDVEAIDLYQLHHPDPKVPIEESVGALADFQREGLIRLIGVSNFDAALLARASSVARIDSVQNYFSAFHAVDRELIRDLDSQGIAYIAHSPFGGASRVGHIEVSMPTSVALAARLGMSLFRMLVAWELQLSPNIVPIVGARKTSSIVDSFEAITETLLAEDIAIIDAEVASLAAAELHP